MLNYINLQLWNEWDNGEGEEGVKGKEPSEIEKYF